MDTRRVCPWLFGPFRSGKILL